MIAAAAAVRRSGRIAAAPGIARGDQRMLAIAIHGGAGTISHTAMSADNEASYRAGLAAALDAGYGVLDGGGSSLDAVSAAVRSLEDDPLFNAGRGAVLAHDGSVELDAAVMEGRQLRAGAVAGIRRIRNPVVLARLVMERSPYVMLIGAGAEEFAVEQGLALVPNEYFRTAIRERQLERVRHGARAAINDLAALGTVGAVARDAHGDLAAATSTGGLMDKRCGRVGDSPIIGAGTYADNASCAVSATGHGEFFIRHAVAHDICARVAYGGVALARAVQDVLQLRLKPVGGEGGVIAIDPAGEVAMDFNTDGMYRGFCNSRGQRSIAIFRDR
jgi:L-asparaginase / beta-aspartyl-peptidase